MINRALYAIFEGYRKAKEDELRKREFEQIASSPFLHSSSYLSRLADNAKDRDELNCILDNLYTHDAYHIRDDEGNVIDFVPSYKKLEEKIIGRMWNM